ncbi:bifunctional 5,10-methylenetetrahydrofolate dehydrogenase/5,10-methenyltetrahydrofolate cyclohydrolase [Neisseria sp. Ec49-e6-T10]|uniref:bifunctional 5,10-methylenetetrahydrofolate dehydrogenase/5,10-methenyltetrahydrofolate cyclohydrolase n=1 Tax=Neisseria sp. Ec49-e6-T10 TaxID=3140744 RepID=UPI003EB8587C
MQLIKGSDTVKRLKKEIEQDQVLLKGITPQAAIIRLGEKSDDIAYERSAIKTLTKYQIDCHSFTFSKNIPNTEFLSKFKEINKNTQINSILLLRPLPKHIDIQKIECTINPLKDIDGISPMNIGKMFNEDESGFAPCTAEAAMEMLKTMNVSLRGKRVVIVGCGPVVGRPLSLLMLSAGATVVVCNEYTQDLAQHTKKAEILIVATGVRGLITAKHVSSGMIVIDIGINTDEQGHLCGDVRFNEVAEIVTAITPVPGGIGVVTTCILARNVYKATKLQRLS